MTATPAQRLYTLPEPVQEQLCRLVDAIAGMDAVEKFCAHTQITQTAAGLIATGDVMSEPAAEVAAITATLLGTLAAQATPEFFKEGVV